TDITRITIKDPKPDKNGHENRKTTQEPRIYNQKSTKVNPDSLPTINQRVSVLEKDVQELKAVDHTTTLLASLRSKIPLVVNAYLGSSMGDALQKVLQKHTEELIQQYPQQVNYQNFIKESMQANIINKVKNLLAKFLPKAVSDFSTPVIQSTTILFDKMDKSSSYLTHDKNQALYDALFNSLCLDDVIEHGQADPEKILSKRDRDNEEPSTGPNQGKMTKKSETKESEPSKKSSTTRQ
nr:hypothetical protein [Tanacetum cinerariifolium]